MCFGADKIDGPGRGTVGVSRVCEEALGSNLALRGKEGEGRGGER